MQLKKYFSYKGNSFLYTNDNWKHFSMAQKRTPGNDYILETNQDVVFKTKLKHEFGEKAAKVILREIKNINGKYNEKVLTKLPKKTGFGHEFEILAISVLCNVSIDDVISKYIVKGTADGGIDAIFYTNKDAHVYQIKMGHISDDAIQTMKNTISCYIKNRLAGISDCESIRDFLDNMAIPINKINNIDFKTISTNGKLEGDVDYSFIFKEYLKNLVIKKTNKSVLNLEKKVGVDQFDFCENNVDNRTFFMFARAKTLVEDIKKCCGNDYALLFSENVRGDLGENKHMISTLVNNPKMFCAYNNGISITGSYKKPQKGGMAFNVQIVNPNIINGQQTVLNLIKAYENGIDLKDVTVPLFVKNIDESSEELNIAKFNNTQKSISPIDLLSLDLNLRTIQTKLLESGFYLNLISSGKNSYIQNAKRIFGSNRIVKLSDFVKLFSTLNNPNDIGKWKNNFNSQVEDKYKDGFPLCSIEKSKKICESICRSKDLIKSNKTDYAIADLPIQYLFFNGFNENQVKIIIDYVNSTYSPSVKKKADIYKKQTSMKYIKDGISYLKKQK